MKPPRDSDRDHRAVTFDDVAEDRHAKAVVPRRHKRLPRTVRAPCESGVSIPRSLRRGSIGAYERRTGANPDRVVLKPKEAPHVHMDGVETVPAADEIVRWSNRPVPKAGIELDRADGIMIRTDEHSATCGTANFSVQRESEQRKNQERFHDSRY